MRFSRFLVLDWWCWIGLIVVMIVFGVVGQQSTLVCFSRSPQFPSRWVQSTHCHQERESWGVPVGVLLLNFWISKGHTRQTRTWTRTWTRTQTHKDRNRDNMSYPNFFLSCFAHSHSTQAHALRKEGGMAHFCIWYMCIYVCMYVCVCIYTCVSTVYLCATMVVAMNQTWHTSLSYPHMHVRQQVCDDL